MHKYDVLLRPVTTEKTDRLLESDNQVFFEVARQSNKRQIHEAVESIFGVTVMKVNTLNRKGKRMRNRRTGVMSRKASSKRAMVTLADGDSIELFEV